MIKPRATSLVALFLCVLLLLCGCAKTQVYRYRAKSPVPVDLTAIRSYVNQTNASIEMDTIKSFDASAVYLGYVASGRFADTPYAISENRTLFGYDGVVMYSGKSIPGFDFVIPNVSYREFADILRQAQELFRETELDFADMQSEQGFTAAEVLSWEDDAVIKDATLRVVTKWLSHSDETISYYKLRIWVEGANFLQDGYSDALFWHETETIYNEAHIFIE